MLTQEQLDTLLAGVNEPDTEECDGVSGKVLSPACLEITINTRTIGLEQANRVFREISKLSANSDQNLILNVGNCPFLSSFVIGQLVSIAAEKKERGFRLVMVEAAEMIIEVLNLTGMVEMIDVYPTTKEALKKLNI